MPNPPPYNISPTFTFAFTLFTFTPRTALLLTPRQKVCRLGPRVARVPRFRQEARLRTRGPMPSGKALGICLQALCLAPIGARPQLQVEAAPIQGHRGTSAPDRGQRRSLLRAGCSLCVPPQSLSLSPSSHSADLPAHSIRSQATPPIPTRPM